MHGRWRLAVLLLGLAGVAAWGYRAYRALPDDAYSPTYPDEIAPPVAAAPAPQVVQTTIAAPLSVRIADTTGVKIEGGRYVAFPFSGESRSECRVTGNVRALSGGDRRVNVFVVDRVGLEDLEGGRTPRTYFESGPVADAALDFKVDGRSAYTLVVSNAGARARAKTVRLRNIAAACSD